MEVCDEFENDRDTRRVAMINLEMENSSQFKSVPKMAKLDLNYIVSKRYQLGLFSPPMISKVYEPAENNNCGALNQPPHDCSVVYDQREMTRQVIFLRPGFTFFCRSFSMFAESFWRYFTRFGARDEESMLVKAQRTSHHDEIQRTE